MAVALFTGFPGFIGVRLLPRLLELQPELRVACLVQPRFLDLARSEIAGLEERRPDLRGRLETVTGDITAPGLGLDAAAADRLRGELTSAYHLAAVYDLAVTRELGLKVNVDGTRHVLDFLKGARSLDRLHYVSTCYVAGDATGVFTESDLEKGQGFKNHYEETKYLAEVDVVKSGLPFTVYRPSIVVGDSRTGETAKFDGPYFTLTAMERIPSRGVFFRIGSGKNPANLVPVDYVIEGLAQLASAPESRGRTYHLADPAPSSVFEVGELFARQLGKTFFYLPVPKAVAKALFRPRSIQRAFGMPAQALDYFDHPCRFDTTLATRDLAAKGVTCPRLPDYVGTLVDFYLKKKGQVRRSAMV
jgi:thioester reductase-like protein